MTAQGAHCGSQAECPWQAGWSLLPQPKCPHFRGAAFNSSPNVQADGWRSPRHQNPGPSFPSRGQRSASLLPSVSFCYSFWKSPQFLAERENSPTWRSWSLKENEVAICFWSFKCFVQVFQVSPQQKIFTLNKRFHLKWRNKGLLPCLKRSRCLWQYNSALNELSGSPCLPNLCFDGINFHNGAG